MNPEPSEQRSSYVGPIEPGMVMVGLGNEGEPSRRDLVLGFHPFKKGVVIYEALPCKMRKRLGSGVGEIGLFPEVNMRYAMRPEESAAAPVAPPRRHEFARISWHRNSDLIRTQLQETGRIRLSFISLDDLLAVVTDLGINPVEVGFYRGYAVVGGAWKGIPSA